MRRSRKILAGCITILIVVAAIVAVGYYRYTHRPLPDAITEKALFEGITYTRDIRSEPRPLIVHVVNINLDAPGIHFLVTPADDREDEFIYNARTVSDFVDEFGVQLAVNGDFFQPWRDNGPQDYYPHRGDGVNVAGLTISNSELVTEGYSRGAVPIYFTRDNRVIVGGMPSDAVVENVISGWEVLIDAGEVRVHASDNDAQATHPRTALALDKSTRTLMLFVIDGRQPNYSEGVTLVELAQIMLEYGAYEGVNLDGGGSSALVMQNAKSEPEILNSPIHTRIPGRERPVANHFGVFANRID